MRVLWFSTNPSCYKSFRNRGGGYNGGGWMSSLQRELLKHGDITLGVCFCADGEPEKDVQDGVAYYPVPPHKKPVKDKLLDLIHSDDVARDEILWGYYINRFKQVIDDFKPDVIQVFGSELYIGLGVMAARERNVPCVLHLQGFLSLYIYIYLIPGVSRLSYIFKDGIRKAYANFQYLVYWRRSCHREKAILCSVSHVIGRTDWDRRAMEVLNPSAQYHYGGEILRPCFYIPSERQLGDKVIITTTISSPPYKGFDMLLKTAKILKEEIGLSFVWNCYGNVDPSFAEKTSGIRHEDVNVCLCGVATAEQLREALLCSTIYCHTSYVENSPNSVGEAQILGIPVVATNVGGTSSMVEGGATGLLYPATDPYMAASCIKRLVTDKTLNKEMGISAKSVALKRHDRQTIVQGLLDVYNAIRSGEK